MFTNKTLLCLGYLIAMTINNLNSGNIKPDKTYLAKDTFLLKIFNLCIEQEFVVQGNLSST